MRVPGISDQYAPAARRVHHLSPLLHSAGQLELLPWPAVLPPYRSCPYLHGA